jgi:hypothetical protein
MKVRNGLRVWCALTALLALFFLNTPSSLAQEISAGMTGRITDPTGAAVAGASVTAKDVNRGTVWPTTTNDEGIFAFPRVPTGTYELRIEAKGFKSLVRPGITLELDQRARLDLTLEIGAVNESIEVTGAAPLLNTETTIIGAVLTSNTVMNTPLASRNFISLTLLAPGVTTTDPSAFNNGKRTASGGVPYVNGNRAQANNFLLDGIDNNEPTNDRTAYQPNLDAIQEVKMITNNASAEFGNFQGGVINVTMKSGTNDLHGTAFEFFRNDKLNANNWARNFNGNVRSPIRWNEFGGTLGGPVKHDKIFFFGDYQSIRQSVPPAVSTISVIPAEYRTGDFSRLSSEMGIGLYDPLTADASGNKTPFANNQIPTSRRNIVATNLFNSTSLYPNPANTALRYNQYNAAGSQILSDQFDAKMDAKLSSKDDFSVRYSWGRQELPTINSFPLTFNSYTHNPFQNGVVNWTRTISPSMVNEARMGINRITLWAGSTDKGLGNVAQNLGIQNGNERGPGLMLLQFSGGYATGIGSAQIGTQQKSVDNNFHYADNLTIIRGRHMIKTGGQLLRLQLNSYYAGGNGRMGIITYDGHFSSNPSPYSKGFAEADFYLGYPSDVARGLDSGTWGQRKTMYGLYVQDDWRVNNELTLNLGVRWEYHTPIVEVANRESNFEPFSGKLLLAGQDGNSRSLYEPFRKDFQPRVGFAWTPKALGKKTVFRGAYTISSFMEGTGTNLRLTFNPPYSTTYESVYSSNTPGQTTDQGFTTISAKDPYKGATIMLWDPRVRPANVQQWSFTMEHQLPGGNVLTASYVGQHGTHLIVPMPYFQKHLLSDGSIVKSQYLSGNPALASISQISGTEANGNQRYDSLQIQARKRLSFGFEYQVSYTYSKGMTDSIGYYGEGGQAASASAYWQNLYDRKAEWGPTYFDAKHMLTSSYTYAMPFGHGRKWGTSANPFVNGLLGGWNMGGVFTSRSGFPITVTATDRSNTSSRGPRANRIGNGEGTKSVGPGRSWLDKSAFTSMKAGTFGSSGVGVLRGPGLIQFDLSLQKQFPIKEKYAVEFRSEFFNLTNTPHFGAPVQSVDSATFGEITTAQGERSIQFALKFRF